ncbi:hypothetical protein [uncultured Winogradskyella sp.]|uniref:hypothetical protein n=1 Tax=uncultured Winogradskyella sp. TaxID=395353 RepID=UPI0026320F73|nr:hypothetical protein [uncultured Winogradskyella sp.]
MKKFTYLFITLFCLGLMTTSCREEKSTGEKVEDAVENAADEAGDAVEDAADEVEDAVDDM